MQELERMINIYHTAFIVFMVLGIVFLLASVIMFFRFNIRENVDMRTGRGAKRTIQKMQEMNDQTGKLREEAVGNTPSTLRPEERVAPPAEKQAYSAPVRETETTERLADTGAQETTLLHAYNETTVLSENMVGNTPSPVKAEMPGMFQIEKEIILVHTEERL